MDPLGAKDSRFAMMLFAIRVFALYILLLMPWPGLRSGYEAWFCQLAARSAIGGTWSVQVGPMPPIKKIPLSTELKVFRSDAASPNGKKAGVSLGLDAWGVGWIPTALLISLILNTSIPWRRRWVSLLYGLLAMNVAIAFSIRMWLWHSTADLFQTVPIERMVSGALSYTLITQMGAGFVIAILIWLGVTIRAEDTVRWRAGASSEIKSPKKAKRLLL